MSEETQEVEDIIEDITEEQLITNEELEQDTPEEVSEEVEAEEASFDDSIKSILLGEKKAVKKEEEEDEEESEEEEEEEEEEMEEGYMKASKSKKKKEVEEDEEEDEESEEEEDEEEEDEEEAVESKKKVSEALNLLITNQAELSEDFKTEASTLFEAAIAERSLEIQENLEAQYNAELNEEVNSLRESLITRMDEYLSYVVESWIEDNSEQVENTLRTEIAENFMSSLKDLFIENYIEVPAEKRDIVEELNTSVEETNAILEEATTEIETLNARIESFERGEVIASLSEDLSETEIHRLKSILEDVEFSDKEKFAKKAQTVKNSIFELKEESSQEDSLAEDVEEETEIVIEGQADPLKKLPASMRMYVDALSK